MLNRLESYLIQIIKGDKKGIRAKIVLFFLSLMELIYLVIIKIRNKLYQFNWFKSKKIEATVISIGNITGGGTGKTPLVDKVAKELNKFEKNIAVLSRGYQGKNEKPKIVKENKNFKKSIEKYGDEALMLNRQLSGIPIIIGKKRYESGKKAVNSLNTKIIILDDGFQHRQLDRDLDILIIDALNPFGYNHLIP
ncbi:MAG: tetraacyldisaccharide 4'-kinase, partial [Halanaerobiales bacterium]